MKKRLWLAASLLVAVALLAGGCASTTIKTLTGSERNTMVRVALAHPEVAKWLDTAEVYGVEVGWSIVSWNNSEATGWARVAYEEIADGSFPPSESFPPESTSIHPDVLIRLRNPPRMHIHIAFDRKTMEVVAVQFLERPATGPTPAKDSHPEGMKNLRWLTDAEKDRVIEIALNETKASKYLKESSQYKTDLSWIAIVWDNSKAVEWWGLDYEWVDEEILPPPPKDMPPGVVMSTVPESAEFYSRVVIKFGEPPQWQVMAAINPDTGKVALVEEYPFRTGPTPPK